MEGQAQRHHNSHDHVAASSDSVVVARFAGGMAYGSRAFCNQFTIYRTTGASVNYKPRRTEFMPFAPATHAKSHSSSVDTSDPA
jgi:predicted NodU family carbamoyl transferase